LVLGHVHQRIGWVADGISEGLDQVRCGAASLQHAPRFFELLVMNCQLLHG
jgi:hypothetical protein